MYGAPLVVLRVTFDLITFYFKFFIIAFRTCPGTVACERVCLNRIACAHPNAFPGHSVVPQYPFYSPAGMELHSNGCPDNVPNPLSPREVIRHGRRRCGLARHPRGRLEVDQADSGELRERSVGVFVKVSPEVIRVGTVLDRVPERKLQRGRVEGLRGERRRAT